MAHFYDVHWKTALAYQIGDKVWLSSQNITIICPTKKLDHKWLGPYKVNKGVSRNAYGLQLLPSFGQTHPVFSVTLLHSYEENTIPECYLPFPPPPIVRDGIEEY